MKRREWENQRQGGPRLLRHPQTKETKQHANYINTPWWAQCPAAAWGGIITPIQQTVLFLYISSALCVSVCLDLGSSEATGLKDRLSLGGDFHSEHWNRARERAFYFLIQSPAKTRPPRFDAYWPQRTHNPLWHIHIDRRWYRFAGDMFLNEPRFIICVSILLGSYLFKWEKDTIFGCHSSSFVPWICVDQSCSLLRVSSSNYIQHLC